MENVPQVHSKENIGDFNAWLRKLESLGYKNYYKDLNSKDFGVPQNRNRAFCVSILGDYYYEFPDPIPLKLKLKDLLEPTVDEKYYISEKATEKLITCSQTVNVEREVGHTVRAGGRASLDRHSWDIVVETSDIN